MKGHYLFVVFLLFVTACHIPSSTSEDFTIVDLDDEKVYSIEEYKEKCSFPKEFEFRAFVIKKSITECSSCPIDVECGECVPNKFLIIGDKNKELTLYEYLSFFEQHGMM